MRIFFIYFFCVIFTNARDRFYDNNDYSRLNYNSPRQRYVDIYTNYPHSDNVVSTYDNLKSFGERYVYPGSDTYTNRRWDGHNRNRLEENRRRFHNSHDNHEDFKYDETLQSDYGEFESYGSNYEYNIGNEHNNVSDKNDSYSKRRPKFKTKNNLNPYTYNDLYSSDSQNTLKYEKLESSEETEEDINQKLRDIVRNYLIKIYKKKYQTEFIDHDKAEEIVNASLDISDNIETMVNQEEHDPRLYEIAPDMAFQNLYLNKSKFLDQSKLMIFKNSTKALANKFLSLFTIIKFPNMPCVGKNQYNSYYDGTCYYSTECQAMNGTAMGPCADGYGVCCVFRESCGATSSRNCTYFESPDYPNYYPYNSSVLPPPPFNGSVNPRMRYPFMMYFARQDSVTNSLACKIKIVKANNNVRAFRVDFVDLELRGPTNGTCIDEMLIISGQNKNNLVPPICGYNSGQHVYVDVSSVTDVVQIEVASRTIQKKRFRLRVCQLTDCSIPSNCLQYYTGIEGAVSSFNYEQADSLSRSSPQYFNNLNYAICIRKEAGYCSITYTTSKNGTMYPFQLLNIDMYGQLSIPPGQAGAEVFNCPDDFLVINGIRLCGDRLNDATTEPDMTMNAPVMDTTSGPFIIPVRTDSNVVGTGFKLFYMQNRCTP